MSKSQREVWEFDEARLAEELSAPVEVVAAVCQGLLAEGLIDYRPPTTIVGGISKASLPIKDWRKLYGLSNQAIDHR